VTVAPGLRVELFLVAACWWKKSQLMKKETSRIVFAATPRRAADAHTRSHRAVDIYSAGKLSLGLISSVGSRADNICSQ
jgi:hypothetical protein